MRSKRTILVDMDGVLVDLLPTWLHLYGIETGEWIHPDTITAYGHEQFVTHKAIFWQCLGHALDDASPLPGSTAIRMLLNDPLAFDVYIVTYAHHSAPHAHRAKLNWLKRYFPEIDGRDVVFTGHKDLVRGDILIEDSPDKLKDWLATNPEGWGIIIDHPYNREYSHERVSRVRNMEEAVAAINNIFDEEEFYASK